MGIFELDVLVGILISLIILSGFFSAAETGMMATNRYRLRHKARQGNVQAKRVNQLLEKPDRLLGVILIGNNVVNIMASAIATYIAVTLYGAIGVVIATAVMTIVILIFAEITPKTMAAIYSERVAFFVSLPLLVLLKLLYPFVWLVNMVSNFVLRLFGIKVTKQKLDKLSKDELRTVVRESSDKQQSYHNNMLLGLLDLDRVKTDNIMIPRNEIVAIDIDADWNTILNQIKNTQHVRLPVYSQDINNIKGILHVRSILHLLVKGSLDKQNILKALHHAYFIPESLSLHQQLENFRKARQRLGLVVDEYGMVIGLITLEDILEEVVGQYTTSLGGVEQEVVAKADGSYIIDGSANLRDLNRLLNWKLPIDEANTLSGLIIEHLETFPKVGEKIVVANYEIEVLAVKYNKIERVKVKAIEDSN